MNLPEFIAVASLEERDLTPCQAAALQSLVDHAVAAIVSGEFDDEPEDYAI